MEDTSTKPKAVIGVFPLFPEKAASPAMVHHAMKLTLECTTFLNPGQIGVLGADQQSFAVAKQLQWVYPDSIGVNKLVMMMGALHIEDKIHQMVGKLLRDSGWSTVLSQAQVLTHGRAQSALNEHHIKRTRYAHQVTLSALHILKGLQNIQFYRKWSSNVKRDVGRTFQKRKPTVSVLDNGYAVRTSDVSIYQISSGGRFQTLCASLR